MMNEANSVSDNGSWKKIVEFVYSEETKNDAIPPNVTHVKVGPCVKEISAGAFRKLSSLVQVEFSEGLEVIGSNAFAGCTNLRHAKGLSSTLKEIGNRAFFECDSIENLVLPKELTKIGSSAFHRCRKLKQIKIPSSSIAIQDSVFAECTSLTSIEFPEGLEIIGESWFQGCSALVAFEIPTSVVEIRARAFSHCISIENAHLPASLSKVGDAVFKGCNGLKFCNLPVGLTIIASELFNECTSLTQVVIPETVRSIGAHAFRSCSKLEHVRIPPSVTRLGNCAFILCGQLRSVEIDSDGLTRIERSVFELCPSLTHLRLPSSIAVIENDAFSRCPGLVSLELPKGLKHIWICRNDNDARYDIAIEGCESLVNLVVPASQQVSLDEELIERNAMNQLPAFAHVSRRFETLVPILQHRFDNKPVHELCYYHSYYPVEETLHRLNQAIHENPSTVLDVDALGMTPFHILALSQTPMLRMFEALLDITALGKDKIGNYPMYYLCIHDADITAVETDKFGKSPMDYLCMNHTPKCTAVIRSLLQKAISKRTKWLGLDQWKNDINSAFANAVDTEWSLRRQEIELLYVRVAELERMEAVSLLELSIWKMKIDEKDLDDRKICRVKSGAEVIIRNTLLFLNKVQLVPFKRRRLCR